MFSALIAAATAALQAYVSAAQQKQNADMQELGMLRQLRVIQEATIAQLKTQNAGLVAAAGKSGADRL